MSSNPLSASLMARLRARAADPARCSDTRGLAANSVSLESLLGDLPRIQDPEVRGHVDHLQGLLANVMSMFGNGETGRTPGFAMVGPSGGFPGSTISLGGGEPALGAAAAPCGEGEIRAAEAALGFALPAALRQLYLEIGDGGFGPGDGLYGLDRLVAKYRDMTAEPVGPQGQAWPAGLLPISGPDWDVVAIDRDSGRLIYWDVELLADDEEEDEGNAAWTVSFRDEADSLEAWLAKWLDTPTYEEQRRQWEEQLTRGKP